jgi:Zn-dependent protease
MESLALFLLWYFAFIFSVSAHEMAHAWAAVKGGDLTPKDQLTLNPVPHIRREPIGMVVFPIISYMLQGFMFGWASAPLNPYWIIRNPRPAGWVALAGPLANLGIAILASAVIIIGLNTGLFTVPYMISMTNLVGSNHIEGLARFISILFSLNIILFVFNLIPVPPLDGASVLGLLLPERMTLRLFEIVHNPQFAMIGLLVVWMFAWVIIQPAYKFFVGLLLMGYPL